jgi:hypothetical protein
LVVAGWNTTPSLAMPGVLWVQVERTTNSRIFLEGGGHLWKAGTKDMRELGAGVVLYFALLKYLAIAFSVLMLLSLPALYLAAVGQRGQDSTWNLQRLAIAEAGPPVSLPPPPPIHSHSIVTYIRTHTYVGALTLYRARARPHPLIPPSTPSTCGKLLQAHSPHAPSPFPPPPLPHLIPPPSLPVSLEQLSAWGTCTTDSPTFPGCMADLPFTFPFTSWHTRFELAALLFPATDMLCCFLFIVFILVLRDRVPNLARQVDGSNVTSADYSVRVDVH